MISLKLSNRFERFLRNPEAVVASLIADLFAEVERQIRRQLPSAIRKIVPVRTGRLRDFLSITIQQSGNTLSVSVRFEVFYAPFVNAKGENNKLLAKAGIILEQLLVQIVQSAVKKVSLH